MRWWAEPLIWTQAPKMAISFKSSFLFPFCIYSLTKLLKRRLCYTASLWKIFVCKIMWKVMSIWLCTSKAVTNQLFKQCLSSDSLLSHKTCPPISWSGIPGNWNGLLCILNPSIWLYWVMLRSGNAIQIWVNEFYFKDLGLRL